MKQCKILAPSAGIDITVPMGDGRARLVDGLGGWKTVEMQDALAVTDWSGQPPLTQDVFLALDGGRRRRSIERQLAQILRLGRDPDGGRPPIFQVWGPVHYPGKHWVLPAGGIELSDAEDECCWRNDGELYRQFLTLHLLEYRRPDAVRLRRRRPRGKAGLAPAIPVEGVSGAVATGSAYKVTEGARTLSKIAAKVYGDYRVWEDIGKRNGIADPNKVLAVGRVLRLP